MSTERDELGAFAAGLLRALPEITNYLGAILQQPASAPTPVQRTARGLLDRAACWLATMGRLNLTTDYQAHLAGLRAIMELTVDLGLLHADPTQNEKIEAWELSAKYKFAASVADYVPKHPAADFRSTPGKAAAFVKENKETVDRLRRQFWPLRRSPDRGEHPSRWTGRNLRSDVERVQERFPNTQIGLLYAETYAMACWHIHGSGLVLSRNTTPDSVIPGISIALNYAPELALNCAEFSLRILGGFSAKSLEEARERWLASWGGEGSDE